MGEKKVEYYFMLNYIKIQLKTTKKLLRTREGELILGTRTFLSIEKIYIYIYLSISSINICQLLI